ncbi:mycofactocin-coupled SDR family oxidoreductase [Amycolatopsis taiwanensis]|uniref:Short-chain dehydrogenase/reductase n=1 Tax=Amycolatopsis taiwanensis TaxID=342230 RepID=A0A9W6VBW7_9PSEU|nr:mycofactocin-coupled SDR family oxidoreductase [Amycolatopsis taiwanensis]GLY65453.1 putative short-chain dehydrogenase/reductase [Amycolatopsis taiwanensis]
MGQLDGRVALVTGGARGQGRAHARALAAQGAHVVVCDIAAQVPTVAYPMATAEDLDETVETIRAAGGMASAATVDVRDSKAVDEVVGRTVAEFGRLDVLVANAGICGFSRVTDISDDSWHDMIETNLGGVFRCVRAVLPHMTGAGYGRIVATSSGAGRGGMATLGHYVAAKWGLIGLIKSVALETARTGVTANVVCPTTVRTPMVVNDASFATFCPGVERPEVDDVVARLAAMDPMGVPWLEPEDVTRAVLYFVTDPGRTSGTVLEVDLATSARRT